jgi:N-acetylglucosaminyldiphosphoundecaprenol N-acetyl-beta-D-mannosaminyltransferase
MRSRPGYLRPMPETSFDVLGISINAAPFDAVVARVLSAPDHGERLSVHFATAHSIVEASENPAVREAFDKGLVEPDGMPLVWLGRRQGLAVERVCGPDFMPAVIRSGVPLGRSHYFYGGAPGVAQSLAERFAIENPGLRVAGIMSPPFRALSDAEDDAIMEKINSARPDYVWVGLGAPKQDVWVATHRATLHASVLLAVGAAFDFHAGIRARAPRWMQRTGTEWLYRLAREPRRLAGRYTRVNARFIGMLVRHRARGR